MINHQIGQFRQLLHWLQKPVYSKNAKYLLGKISLRIETKWNEGHSWQLFFIDYSNFFCKIHFDWWIMCLNFNIFCDSTGLFRGQTFISVWTPTICGEALCKRKWRRNSLRHISHLYILKEDYMVFQCGISVTLEKDEFIKEKLRK